MSLIWLSQCCQRAHSLSEYLGPADLSQSYGWSQGSLYTSDLNLALLSDLCASPMSPTVVSAFLAAFPGESQFSCSEQEVHPRASQLTKSLRGLVFDSSLPTAPCEQAQRWQKHSGADLLR